jgi:hypothetical protein
VSRPLDVKATSQSRYRDGRQIYRGKFDRLPHATAESTTSALDGYGLRVHLPARPAPYASDPVLIHRLVRLLHASFRPRLTASPLRFAIISPHQVLKRTFTSKLSNMLGTQKGQLRRGAVGACPCPESASVLMHQIHGATRHSMFGCGQQLGLLYRVLWWLIANVRGHAEAAGEALAGRGLSSPGP